MYDSDKDYFQKHLMNTSFQQLKHQLKETVKELYTTKLKHQLEAIVQQNHNAGTNNN